MKNIVYKITLIIAMIVFAFPLFLRAEMITFEVEGAIVGFDGPRPETFEVGQTYIARFTFNSDAIGTPIFGGGANYEGAVTMVNFTIGSSYAGTLADSSATNIRVADNHFGHNDNYEITIDAVDAPPIQTPVSGLVAPSQLALIHLFDYSIPLDGLSSNDLPLTPPDLTLFNVTAWWLEFEGSNYYGRVRGSISSVTLCLPVVSVDIDIKPGSCPNKLNMDGKGILTVAVLGTEDLDVTAIDTASVRLEGIAPIRSSLNDVAGPVLDREDVCDCTNDRKDGFDDLVLKFTKSEVLEVFGEVPDGETLELMLTGDLTNGTPFEGKDCIVTIY